MPYSKQLSEQMQDLFERDIYNRGRVLQRDQRVTALQTTASISASVDDPDEGNCKTFIAINSLAEGLIIDGECSCEQELNCAHVVATLLQYIDSTDNAKPLPQYNQAEAVTAQQSLADSQTDRQLHYVLSRLDNRLKLQLYVLSAGQAAEYVVPHSQVYPARFMQPSDLLLLQQIQQQTRVDKGDGFILSQLNETLISALIESGRCHWLDPARPVLQAGPVINGRWLWQQHIDGRQQLILQPQDDRVEVLPLLPPRYLDTGGNYCGLIESGLTAQQDQQLFSIPAVDAEQMSSVLDRSELKPLLSQLPRPQSAQHFITQQQAPQICVHISLSGSTAQGRHKKTALFNARMTAQLSFIYPGGSVQPYDPAPYVGEFCADSFIRWQRDTKQEEALIGLWQQQGWLVHDGAGQLTERWQLAHALNGLGIARFLAFSRPKLRLQGWVINGDETCPEVLSARDFPLIADFTESRDQRKFRLRLMLSTPQQPFNLLRAVHLGLQWEWLNPQGMAEQGCPSLITDGQRIVIIENSDLTQLLEGLIELNSRHALDEEGAVELSLARYQAVNSLLQTLTLKLDEQTGLKQVTDTGIAVQPSSGVLSHQEQDGLKAQLRPYQQEGVDWLHRLLQHRLGGLLADDMGLGKTLQILCFLWQCKFRGQLQQPVLILAPTSLLANWKAEAERFTPGLRLQVLHGPKRAEHYPHLNTFDLIITSYPLLIRDVDSLLDVEWAMLILDEAQAIKNAGSRCARAVREFNAGMNICLSGTPLENHLGELWALFDFMLPGLLGSKSQFNDWFKIPIHEQQNAHRQEMLVQRIAPVMLRRDKQTVLPQLPPKIHQLSSIQLTDEQQQIYQGIELQMRKTLRESIQQRGVDGSRLNILNALTRLRQVCCDPRLLAETAMTSARHSAKLNQLLEMLDEMLQQGRRILLFSQFTSMLSLVELELKKKAIRYALLTGKTRDRQHQVERFQQGEVPLFLISLKAGGSGLNLTRADTVIHYDPWWNPAVENQATDRAHRIGQCSSVMVYKLIAADTIEQKIVEMQQNKQLIADTLLGDASTQGANINSSDLTRLLELLGV